SNDEYQRAAPADEFRFPPGSSWVVYTDTVSHAVLSGRFALEQTFLIARRSLAAPDRAPIAVLERLAGRALA
ncbi:MAG TPA: Kdo hydroxylase family protein, partial [Thermoanaerobaculia bacterium]|nr:Kdo hydroxylase family protein [Thermoanaerobaculia bacterium]